MSYIKLEVYYDAGHNPIKLLLSKNLCFAVSAIKRSFPNAYVENYGFVNKNIYEDKGLPNDIRVVVTDQNREQGIFTHPQNFYLDLKDVKCEADVDMMRDSIVSSIQTKWKSFGKGIGY